MNKILSVYEALLKKHGLQGWWPIVNDKTLLCEYHINAPKNESEIFEICIGAILTQGTQWHPNVVRAIQQLKIRKEFKKFGLLGIIQKLPQQELAELIKSSGYHNQKAKKLKSFAEFYLSGKEITREALLNVWGIGEETADSILLYAYKKPYFVVDEYTKRIFSRLGFCKKDDKYEVIQKIFHDNLEKDYLKKDYKLFNEYHALIVEHAKVCCRKKESRKDCPLENFKKTAF